MDSKIMKLLKEPESTRFGEDKISKLPDSLLHHILSFLPTKKAFVTSILSTRWRYLFNSIPSLDFDVHYFNGHTDLKAKRYMNFVERRLLLRGMSNIQKFRLSCSKYLDESRVNAWICTVIDRKVEELDLWFEEQGQRPSVLPSCLFTCGSLEVLKLDLNSVLEVPPSVSFPKLKVLHLFNIEFRDENPIEHIFSNCPVLVELVISCFWRKLKKFCISAPELEHLEFGRVDWIDHCDGLAHCEVLINAPKLEYLIYGGSIAKEFILPSLPSLRDVTIDITADQNEPYSVMEIADFPINLLRGLCTVNNLALFGDTFEALSYRGDVILKLPRLCNLTRLEVSGYSLCRTLMDFLEIVPNLNTLIFKTIEDQIFWTGEGLELPCDNENGEWILSRVPQCLLSSLKTVEFRAFEGTSWELLVIGVFLKNARVLERLTIISYYPLNQSKTIEISRQLLMLPRASSSCVIKYS